MLLKLFRAVWFLSVIILFANLLYGYAGWGEAIVIQEDSEGQLIISREVFFYSLLAAFIVVNVTVYLIRKMYPAEENFRAWFHGLLITINIFFIVAMGLIGLYNSAEKFDYARIGIIIYGSISLVIAWAIAWPFYTLIQKFFIKQAV